MRAGLAALALDAYPEAYSEFKRLMLAFVFGEAADPSPVADLWKPAQREQLADMLAGTLKQAVGRALSFGYLANLQVSCCRNANDGSRPVVAGSVNLELACDWSIFVSGMERRALPMC